MHSLSLENINAVLDAQHAQLVAAAEEEYSMGLREVQMLWHDARIGKMERAQRLLGLQMGMEQRKEDLRAWVEREEERADVEWMRKRDDMARAWRAKVEAVKIVPEKNEVLKVCESAMEAWG